MRSLALLASAFALSWSLCLVPLIADAQPIQPLQPIQGLEPMQIQPMQQIMPAQQQPQQKMSMAQRAALDEEDYRMFSDMRRVAQWMDQYCLWNNRFPEYGDEMTQAQQQLNQLSPNDPYSQNGFTLGRGLDADPSCGTNFNYENFSNDNQNMADVYQPEYPTPDDQNANLNRIRLSIDNSLSEEEAQQWITNPPDDWQQPPGTISIIGNQSNMYVLWGAGADGRPLRDPLSHHVQLIIGRFRMENSQE